MSKMVKRAYFKVEGTGDDGSTLILTDLSPSKENLGQIELSLVSAEELANQFDTGFKTLDGFDDRVKFFENMIQHRMPIERLLNDAEHEAYPLAVDNIFKINESDETHKATIIHQLTNDSVSSLSHETGYMRKIKIEPSRENASFQYQYSLYKPELTEKLSSDNVQRFIAEHINSVTDNRTASGLISLKDPTSDSKFTFEYNPQNASSRLNVNSIEGSLEDGRIKYPESQFTNVNEARSAFVLNAISGKLDTFDPDKQLQDFPQAEIRNIKAIHQGIMAGTTEVYFTPGFHHCQEFSNDQNLYPENEPLLDSTFKSADVVFNDKNLVIGERVLDEPEISFNAVAAVGIKLAADKQALLEPDAKPSSPKISM